VVSPSPSDRCLSINPLFRVVSGKSHKNSTSLFPPWMSLKVTKGLTVHLRWTMDLPLITFGVFLIAKSYSYGNRTCAWLAFRVHHSAKTVNSGIKIDLPLHRQKNIYICHKKNEGISVDSLDRLHPTLDVSTGLLKGFAH
jgi:hypothetical protein